MSFVEANSLFNISKSSSLPVASMLESRDSSRTRRFVLTDDSVYYVTEKGNINGQEFLCSISFINPNLIEKSSLIF